MSNLQTQSTSKKNNGFALAGFLLGLVSIFTGSVIGIIPILAAIFSLVGLSTFDSQINKNRWQAYIGLTLGILYTLVSLFL